MRVCVCVCARVCAPVVVLARPLKEDLFIFFYSFLSRLPEKLSFRGERFLERGTFCSIFPIFRFKKRREEVNLSTPNKKFARGKRLQQNIESAHANRERHAEALESVI